MLKAVHLTDDKRLYVLGKERRWLSTIEDCKDILKQGPWDYIKKYEENLNTAVIYRSGNISTDKTNGKTRKYEWEEKTPL